MTEQKHPVNSTRSVTLSSARRLALARQCLAAPRPPSTSEGIMKVMRNIRYVQIDPMNIVAPSHLLVLWSRLGSYNKKHLDTLLRTEKQLFEDWAQATSIVLTEDYPIFSALKRGYPKDNSPYAQKVRDWIEKNKELRRHIVTEIRRHGPLPQSRFEDKTIQEWHSTGWTKGRNIDMMLTFLWAQGKIMVAGRKHRQKIWDLTERHLPKWTPREVLSDHELVRRTAQKSLRALGIGSAIHIKRHFTRGCYPNLAEVLTELESEERITRVQISEKLRQRQQASWYVHSEDLPLLDRIEAGEWQPRTTLLSPFDNLISDRQRTQQLFNFKFGLEIYVPKPKRKYGCYVMPIVHGDKLIGRVDPVMDRKKRQLMINAVYAEPDAPMTRETAEQVADALAELGVFLDAEKVVYGRHVPAGWKRQLS